MKQPLELRKIRDFGQIINDSFTFLKDNFKPLFKALFVICGFILLLAIVSSIFQTLNNTANLKYIFRAEAAKTQPALYVFSAIAVAFVFILGQSFIQLVTICYISVYLEKSNKTPSLPEVWGYFKFYIFRVLGSSLLLITLTIIGMFFCFVPGIYLSVVFSLVTPIIVIENASFSYAFNKSFQLIKSKWWLLFGVIFIMVIIVYFGNLIAGIPLVVFNLSTKFATINSLRVPFTLIYSVLRSLLLLAYVLPALGICFAYFSFSEEKEGTGLLGRIDKIGTAQNEEPDLPTEEF